MNGGETGLQHFNSSRHHNFRLAFQVIFVPQHSYMLCIVAMCDFFFYYNDNSDEIFTFIQMQ